MRSKVHQLRQHLAVPRNRALYMAQIKEYENDYRFSNPIAGGKTISIIRSRNYAVYVLRLKFMTLTKFAGRFGRSMNTLVSMCPEMARRKMKIRLWRCIKELGMKKWSDQVIDRKRKVRAQPIKRNYWMYHVIRWYPPRCNNFFFFFFFFW